MRSELKGQWAAWLRGNVARGCSAQSLIDVMTAAGFPDEAARAAVQHALAGQRADAIDSAAAVDAVGAVSRRYRYDAAPIARGNVIHAHDRDVRVLMRCERPQLIVFADVLAPHECAEMIERSRHRLKRSTTVNPETGGEDVIRTRTSEGIWYQRLEDPFVERLDRRIASLTNWPLENGEGLQVLHYATGGEYRAHFDYFAPERPGSAVHTAHGGQRVATLIVYLNDVEEGGETTFPDAGVSVSATRGGAVYFRYMNAERQLDPLSLHAGATVRRGEKWVLTKWMREHAYV